MGGLVTCGLRSFGNAATAEAFAERVGNTWGLEDVVQVDIEVPTIAGDGGIGNQGKQSLRPASPLQEGLADRSSPPDSAAQPSSAAITRCVRTGLNYQVFFDNRWLIVPAEAVSDRPDNPTGDYVTASSAVIGPTASRMALASYASSDRMSAFEEPDRPTE